MDETDNTDGTALFKPVGDATSIAANNAADAQQGLTDNAAVTADCLQVIADTEDAIVADIQNCLNSCQGDTLLCQSCILGDIQDYVNRAGNALVGCQQKVAQAINGAMQSAWSSAFALGVQPPTADQINAAIAGVPVADIVQAPTPVAVVTGSNVTLPDGTSTTTNGGGAGTVNIGGVNVPVITGVNAGNGDGQVTLTPGVNAPYPTSLIECTPNTWGPNEILQWLIQNYGANVQLITMPGANRVGSVSINGTLAPIPNFCPASPPPPPPPPPQTGGTGGTGSTGTGGTPPPTGSNGTGGTPTNGSGSGNGTGTGGTVQPPTTPPATINCNADLCTAMAAQNGYLYADWMPDDPNKPDGSGICFLHNGDTASGGRYANPRLPACGKTDDSVPTPPSTPPSTPPATPTNPIHFGSGDVCSPDSILGAASRLDGFLKDPGTGTTDAAEALGGLSGALITGAATSLAGVNAGIFQPIVSLLGIAAGIENAEFIRQVIEPPVPPGDCHSPAFFLTAFARILPKLFGGWFGAVPDQTQRQWDYSINYLCQNIIPSQAELNGLINRGYIRTDSWEVATKMQGNCIPWQESVRQLSYSRIGIADAYRLYKLDKISAEEFEKSWKQQGIDTSNDSDKWLDAIQQYPGMADLIRFMTRDVADESIVAQYKLDGEGESAFENKWTDKLQQIGLAQGVTDDIARLYWRAHWQNVAPTQVYDWLHRFRKDDRAADDPNAKLVFSEDDAKQALSVADYIPGLLPFYIAASFKVPNRVDIRRFWEVGVYNDLAQVRQAYRDLGYGATVAEQQAKFTEINSARNKAKLAGNLASNVVVTQYRNNLLTKSEALDLLGKAGLTNDQSITTIEAADVQKRAVSRNIVINSLRTRYFRGEWNDGQAQQQLINVFMDQQQAADTVNLWSAQRQAKEKSPTIAMLCKWYGRGQITLNDFLQRVDNLNYSAADALNIVQACQMDIQQKRDKEIQAALDKQQKQQQAANREAAKAIRDAKAAARALKLQHVTKTKVQHKQDMTTGKVTDTQTVTVTDKPDDNVTNVQEDVEITSPPQ